MWHTLLFVCTRCCLYTFWFCLRGALVSLAGINFVLSALLKQVECYHWLIARSQVRLFVSVYTCWSIIGLFRKVCCDNWSGKWDIFFSFETNKHATCFEQKVTAAELLVLVEDGDGCSLGSFNWRQGDAKDVDVVVACVVALFSAKQKAPWAHGSQVYGRNVTLSERASSDSAFE